jgi:tetratricopeptide (TPR) repeat protein
LRAGRLAEAQAYLTRALELCEGRIDHVTVLGRTYHLLCQTEIGLDRPEAADLWAGKYLELAMKEGFVQEIALARFDLAKTRWRLGRRQEARQLAEDALVLFERLGMKAELEECRRFLASIGAGDRPT